MATGGRLNLLLVLDPEAAMIQQTTPTPAPDPRFHSVALDLNKEDFRGGDTLRLGATVTYGWLSWSKTCDAYLAVSTPGGGVFFLSSAGWSSAAVPIATDFRVADISVDIGSFEVPFDLKEGDYEWCAVLTPPQGNPLRSMSWASNLSRAPFTVTE